MMCFKFTRKSKKDIQTEVDGWIYKSKTAKKIGWFYLKSPKMKEITYNKGATIRYTKHTVYGIGYISDALSFKGVAFFDLPVRSLIVLGILIGVGYASGNIYEGAIWSALFYLLITFLSWNDDESMLHKAKMLDQIQA